MLETDAVKKYCHLSMSTPGGPRWCRVTDCMAWEQWTEPVREKPAEGSVSLGKIVGNKPKEPLQGYCGAIPPEFNCGYS